MTRNHTLYILITAAGSFLCSPLAATAQRGGDPNMGHFYMARQQITITDDAPLVNNKTTAPGAQGAGGLPPGVQQGLPAARWTQYSPTDNPSLSTSLPKVSNGVPPKMPPGQTGARGKAGRLGVGAPRQVAIKKAPASPSGPAAYAPYKRFSPDGAISGASEAQSNSNVKGDVLHWAHRAHNGL